MRNQRSAPCLPMVDYNRTESVVAWMDQSAPPPASGRRVAIDTPAKRQFSSESPGCFSNIKGYGASRFIRRSYYAKPLSGVILSGLFQGGARLRRASDLFPVSKHGKRNPGGLRLLASPVRTRTSYLVAMYKTQSLRLRIASPHLGDDLADCAG